MLELSQFLKCRQCLCSLEFREAEKENTLTYICPECRSSYLLRLAFNTFHYKQKAEQETKSDYVLFNRISAG